VPRLEGVIRQVVTPEAQILQRRRVPGGATVGYNATFTAAADMEVAVINLGYADGYLRAMEGHGGGRAGGAALPLLGRISMDLIALGVDAAPGLGEGDWIALDYSLPGVAETAGRSQYEMLTGLGRRFDRVWH
jgi:alanine racemase